MMEITITGNVLLLMGPIGNFFSRLAKYFNQQGVRVYKINFPLMFELFFPKHLCKTDYFNESIELWPSYLSSYLKVNQIKHIFMSADFYKHHQVAIELSQTLGIDAYVFELGYVRPNFVTLEKERVNARSNLNQLTDEFIKRLPEEEAFLEAEENCGPYWRKLFMPICFIQQTLNHRYKIIETPHKSNPKARYLLNQLWGSLLKPFYALSERGINQRIEGIESLFFVPLQVESDSQITMSSPYSDITSFIREVLASFSAFASREDVLVIKHHPADRGYTNFKKTIEKLSQKFIVQDRVFYVHDSDISMLLSKAKGAVTINSTVGLDCLKASVPLKVMGSTFYDREGLTHQGSLDDFWGAPQPVDPSLFRKFYNHMVRTTQINGHFQGAFPFEKVFT
jgi:capsular polysaccharide export protein